MPAYVCEFGLLEVVALDAETKGGFCVLVNDGRGGLQKHLGIRVANGSREPGQSCCNVGLVVESGFHGDLETVLVALDPGNVDCSTILREVV